MWPDVDGETCLHIGASKGHDRCVETLCYYLPTVEDLYITNKKGYTAGHIAANSKVLKVLYENGANLWITEKKGRMPLFISSFFGRLDCVSFLLDIVSSSGKSSDYVDTMDSQGDTALHAACLCGKLHCAILLAYFINSKENKQGLTPHQLAEKAGHTQLAEIIQYIENSKSAGMSAVDIFGGDYDTLSSAIVHYGSRWSKAYDVSYDATYYVDKVTGQTQWERPETYDETPETENKQDTARDILRNFYLNYNPEKITEINKIVEVFRDNYTELFLKLAERYQVEDLSIFKEFMYSY